MLCDTSNENRIIYMNRQARSLMQQYRSQLNAGLRGADRLVDDDARPALQARIRALVAPALADLGWCLSHADKAPHANWLRETGAPLLTTFYSPAIAADGGASERRIEIGTPALLPGV